ncbi:MAG: RidA family protein [Mailhella sp.]|nr:RidA family protein [Mailhella sp.]
MSIKRFGIPSKPGALPFAKAVMAGGWLFVSGQVSRDSEGEIVSGSISIQAKAALDNLKKVVEDAGYSMNDVVRVNVFLDDPRDFAGFNKVYARYFEAEHAPARVCVQAEMMNDLKVEIDCIAYKPE